MASLTSGSVVRQIGSLFDGSSVAGMSDQDLLDRFTARRDSAGETAFAPLVLRHGPMVLCVCNELLGDRHHAEGAAQAVFLILAQKAHSIRDPDLLGNWLYGVALRTARYARRSRQRNNDRTTSMSDAIPGAAAPTPEQSLLAREQAELLLEEIERLPRAFRLPVVLCYLEGLSVHEAARRLRWSHGTLRSRMARAREKLKRAWPRPVATDDQGRFTLAGIGRDVTVEIHVNDGRFAGQSFDIQTDARDGPNEFSQTLQPATIIDGQVVAADTGEPIPGTVISMSSGVHVRTDEHGRYTTSVPPATHYRAEVFPPEGIPYLAVQRDVSCPKGTVKKTQDFKLPRGVLLRGKVSVHGSGRPLAGASVQWMAAHRRTGVIEGLESVVATKADGSYQIAVPPGKGHLFVYGPTSDYVLEVIGRRMLRAGKPGGIRFYAHDIIPWEVNAGDSPREINSELRPGVIVKGRLIGPAGQTVDNAEIVALLHFNYFHLNWRGDLTIHARDGSFELHGLDPEKPTRVSFLDADHQWGATVDLSGKQSGKDIEVQLLPCGQAIARFIAPDGKPVPRISPQLEILGSSGPSSWTTTAEAQTQLAADAAAVVNLDRKHYWNGMLTDADGRITLPSLIPGATYRINDWSTVNDDNKGVQVRKDFTVKPGETLDLGDILIEKPQAP